MLVEAVMNHGRRQYASFGAARSFLGYMFHQNIIDVDREVVTMLLNRRNRDHDDGFVACPLASLRPGQCAVEMLHLELVRPLMMNSGIIGPGLLECQEMQYRLLENPAALIG